MASLVIGHGRGPPRCRDPGSRDPPTNGRDPPFYFQPVPAGSIATAGSTIQPYRHPFVNFFTIHRPVIFDAPKMNLRPTYYNLNGRSKLGSTPADRNRPGHEGAGWPYALFASSGSIFRNSFSSFRMIQKPGPTMKSDPPPSWLFDELGPVLAAGWAPARVSRHQHFNITPNSSAVDPESYGQSLLISSFELARSDQFHQFQAAFVGNPSAFGVVSVAAGHKVQHLLLAYEVYPLAAFTFHVPRLSFSPSLTQVLAKANRGFASTEILSIGDSLDKSNDICIIVFVWGRSASTTNEGSNQPSEKKPDELAGRGFDSHLLHFGNVAELGIRYRLRPGCSKGHVGSIPTVPIFIGNLERARGYGRVPGRLGHERI